MAQQINDNFQLLAGLPLDERNRKPTITERDAIPSTRRFQGLQCFVEQTQTLYQLQGGIANTNWIGIAGADISGGLESVIDGFYVLLAGKSTPLDWEAGDKFRGWIGGRYLVGSIVSLPVSLPSDIDNPAKVTLAVDSNSLAILPSIMDGIIGVTPGFIVGQTVFSLPTGGVCLNFNINDGKYSKTTANNTARVNRWSQTGDDVTIYKTPVLNNYIYIEYIQL